MSYRLFVHPLARLDILDAVVWYEEQQVDAAIRRAADNPLAFSIVEGTTRRVLCRRFPYAVFFQLDRDRSDAARPTQAGSKVRLQAPMPR